MAEQLTAEELEMKRETMEISGGRAMHLYTFELNGEPMPEMREEDVVEAFAGETRKIAEG